MLKELFTSLVDEGSLCSLSFNSVVVYYDTSAELFCDKFSFTMLRSDSLTSIEISSIKVSCTILFIYLSSSVTLTFEDGAVISI